MKLLKACAVLLLALPWMACHAGDVQPIVIDLSAPTATPGAAATPPPPPPPPSPPPVPWIAESAPMQPQPVLPPEKRAVVAGSPEAIAQSRIDAYNRRDVDSLVSLYAADAKVYDPP